MLALCLALIDDQSDRDKFEEIYQNYKGLIYHISMSILHNNALAEETMQDSFIKIAKNISKISVPVCNKTASFIVIVTRNTAITNLQKEHQAEKISLDDTVADLKFEMPDYTDTFVNAGYRGIFEIIDNMDKIYCDALKLKYIYSYSFSEMAELLGISQQNAEVRVYRGKQILKKSLEDRGYDFE